MLHMNYAAIERTHAQWSASMSELASFAAGRAATPFTGAALRNVLDVPAEAMVSCSQLQWRACAGVDSNQGELRQGFNGCALGCKLHVA